MSVWVILAYPVQELVNRVQVFPIMRLIEAYKSIRKLYVGDTYSLINYFAFRQVFMSS
jgi:hypothetical protein